MWSWMQKSLAKRQLARLKDKQYAFLFAEENPGCYVCFDCETTGLNPQQDKIVSLSAIKIQDNQILTSQSLNLLVRQDKQISPESIVVHQIRNTDLDDCALELMTEREAITRFLKFIEGAALVGYFLEFDVAMVNSVLFPWLGVKLPNRQIEVSALYYQQQIRSKRYGTYQGHIDLHFEAMLKKMNLPNIGQHDAFSDALMTALIFVKLQALASR